MVNHCHLTPELPSRVVVLGSRGFVGADLMRHLRELGVTTVPVSSAEIDLLTPDSVETLQRVVRKDDVLVIVSAITPDKGKDSATLMKNLTMGRHVSAFLVGSACAHVIYISSDAVYDEAIYMVRETSCCSPSSLHGLMHLARERMLAHSLQASSTPLLILRPSLLYGDNDSHNSYGPNRFIRTALKERKITLFGNGEEKRDHVYIQDLSRLIGLCIMYRSEGVLNVATGTSTSFFNVAQIVAALSGDSVRIECLPRVVPVTHQHFDSLATLRAFPSFCYTPLPIGLSKMFNTMLERAND